MNNSQNRSVVDCKITYINGIHTKGRKKGQEKVEEETITIVVPFFEQPKIKNYIEEYCRKKNMTLLSWHIDGSLTEKSPFEFDCENCGEHSINMDPANRKFCSRYCRGKAN